MSKRKQRIPSQSQPAKNPQRCPIFETEFREDLKDLARINPTAYDKVWKLVDECLAHPFTGTGKPEPLKHLGANLWSRRVTIADRLVYRVGHAKIDFLTCRYHYD
ncbi:Txe/YoeB family addiction module toxin [Acaryochloris sp. 'Moss Beach']|uniref:Txe/YoeB family addiction module toxin n=1 Tax=Acaryochloris sp. 'Moss Beach' TaxID=2740837 RepID=UPI001F42D531|nr:Txe/YoeB family addiction module toxin [Acaryochloris sp. 'Moss Beach']